MTGYMVLPSVNRSHSCSDNIWKLRFCFHMVSYEFQNLEILQPLERTRLHIKGLNFEMSLSISVQRKLRHFDEKKKMKLSMPSFNARYLNDLDHWLTRWLPLDAEMQTNSRSHRFSASQQILMLSGRVRF